MHRNCPLIEKTTKQDIKEKRKKSTLDKYAIKFKGPVNKSTGKREEKEKEDKGVLQVGSYIFEECPVAYMLEDRWYVNLISMVNFSEDMRTPLVDGGLFNYTNWFVEARGVIVNEQREIEHEEMEKTRSKNNPSGSSGSKSRGSARGYGSGRTSRTAASRGRRR